MSLLNRTEREKGRESERVGRCQMLASQSRDKMILRREGAKQLWSLLGAYFLGLMLSIIMRHRMIIRFHRNSMTEQRKTKWVMERDWGRTKRLEYNDNNNNDHDHNHNSKLVILLSLLWSLFVINDTRVSTRITMTKCKKVRRNKDEWNVIVHLKGANSWTGILKLEIIFKRFKFEDYQKQSEENCLILIKTNI